MEDTDILLRVTLIMYLPTIGRFLRLVTILVGASSPAIISPFEHCLGLSLIQLLDMHQLGEPPVLRIKGHGHRLRKGYRLVLSRLGG